AETVLVHDAIADAFYPRLLAALNEAGVTVHGDATVRRHAEQAGVAIQDATEEDWSAEYLSLDLAVAGVTDLEAAIEHIRRFSSGHTEAIVTGSQPAARRFVAAIDAAAVVVNASTR